MYCAFLKLILQELLTISQLNKLRSCQETISNTCRYITMDYFPNTHVSDLNSDMIWHELQSGMIYIRQHLDAARLSMSDLRDMIGREGEAFLNSLAFYVHSKRHQEN